VLALLATTVRPINPAVSKIAAPAQPGEVETGKRLAGPGLG